jgi:hypothetical protein
MIPNRKKHYTSIRCHSAQVNEPSAVRKKRSLKESDWLFICRNSKKDQSKYTSATVFNFLSFSAHLSSYTIFRPILLLP